MKALIILFLFPFAGKAQQIFKPGSWMADETIFKTVRMEVYQKDNSKVFSGIKDAVITIHGNKDNPRYSHITMKISGFYEMKEFVINSFTYTLKGSIDEIVYDFTDYTNRIDRVFLKVHYNNLEDKMEDIVVDVVGKERYLLSGFE